MVNPVELRPVAGAAQRPLRLPSGAPPATPFSRILENEVRRAGEVRFSAHARQRLQSHGITLTPREHAQLARGFDLAAAKGARESLFLMDRFALVVSVPNRTVITVVPKNEIDDAVFTNIDSAVVVGEGPAGEPEPMETYRLDPSWESLSAVER